MSKKKENSIDKMAEQFTSPEEMQAYSEAQYKTILSLNEQLKKAQDEIEKLRSDKARINQELSVLKASDSVPTDSKFKTSDEETICVIQIAMLKNLALERELITDEVKRVEILVKTLSLIRGKPEDKKKEQDTSKMSTEELLTWAEDSLKDKQ